MSGEVEVHQGSALAITDNQQSFNPQQLAALHQLGMSDVSEGDLAVFLHHVQRTGLDPFARQVYMISRNAKVERDGREVWEKKWTIQTSIDGFRLIGRRAADRARETLGMSDTEWCDPDGVWHDVWLWDRPPSAARVRIIRNGQPFPGLALFREYAQYTRKGDLTKMWADKPALMIAKCAEALAWRRAFPQDLSGIYTADEMSRDQSDADLRTVADMPPTPPEGIYEPPPRRELPTDTPAEVHRERAKQHAADNYGPRASEVEPTAVLEPLTADQELQAARDRRHRRNDGRRADALSNAKGRLWDAGMDLWRTELNQPQMLQRLADLVGTPLTQATTDQLNTAADMLETDYDNAILIRHGQGPADA